MQRAPVSRSADRRGSRSAHRGASPIASAPKWRQVTAPRDKTVTKVPQARQRYRRIRMIVCRGTVPGARGPRAGRSRVRDPPAPTRGRPGGSDARSTGQCGGLPLLVKVAATLRLVVFTCAGRGFCAPKPLGASPEGHSPRHLHQLRPDSVIRRRPDRHNSPKNS
jgi:hypothetical protein